MTFDQFIDSLKGVLAEIKAEFTANASSTISTNITVSLSNGRTLGKYVNGDVIPSAGKTLEEVLLLLAQESINPTVTLTSPSSIQFNQTAISNQLNFTRVINSLGATVASASLEWRRNNAGGWITLDTSTINGSYTHALTDTNYNSQPFNYRYTVIDSAGGSSSTTLNITPAVYVAPTITIPITSATRELGNVVSNLSSTVTINSTNVPLISYKFQYQLEGSWIDITSGTFTTNTITTSYTHNDLNITSINYRVEVTDGVGTTYSNVSTLIFVYKSVLGYDVDATITLAEILAMSNSALTNSKARTITATSTGGTFTYYCYASIAGDLTNIIKDGSTPDLGAWTKLSDISGVNSFGANVTYRIYKTNSTNAYTNNVLTFS